MRNRLLHPIAGLVALGLIGFSLPALAGTYLFFVPQPTHVGGPEAEVYVTQGFGAHDGLSGSALVDAALAELRGYVPEADAFGVKVMGQTAELSVKEGSNKDAALMNRALGAVFHTLRMAGMTSVKVDGATLSAASFTRGAILPVFPLAAALPPQNVSYGFVLVSGRAVPANDFYSRLNAGDQPIRDAATRLLESGSSAVKLAVLEGIFSLRLKDRHSAVVPRLKDTDLAVRLKALELLTDAGDAKVLKALEQVVNDDESADAKTQAAKILVAAGRTHFKKYLLLEKLKSPNAGEVVDAAKELLNTGDKKMAPAFVDLVSHSSAEVRALGVKGLRGFKQYSAMAKLLENADLNKDVLEPMARTLTDSASGASQAAGISWLLAKGTRDNAVHAAKISGERRVAGTTQALGKALKGREAEVRKAAAIALGALRDTGGLEFLADAVRNSGSDEERAFVSQQAINIIAAMALPQVIKIGESPDVIIRELAVKSLAGFARDRPNPRVVRELRKYLGDSNTAIRTAAVYSLARVKDPKVLDDLVKMKGDGEAGIRAQVAYALTKSKHPEADAILRRYLDDGDTGVKLEAVRGLRERGVKDALPKIQQLVTYRRPDVKRAAMRAVLDLSDPADDKFFDLYAGQLYDKDVEVRLMAVEGLSRFLMDPKAASAIGGAVIDQDVKVQLAAINVLAKSTDPNAVEQVIRGLFAEDKSVKLAALNALEALNSGKAIKALQEFILNESDGDVKRRANEVLDKL